MALRLNQEVLAILPEKPGKNWVFDAYRDTTTGEVAWSRFWPRKVDFTGVAWDTVQTLTLVTPRHVVMARHFARRRGDVVRFHDRRGREVQRVLQGIVNLEGPIDVAVGILNEAVPAGVTHYKLLEPAEENSANLVGALALVTDGERTVQVRECWTVSPTLVNFRYPSSLPEGFYEPLVKGDSGNPSFLIVRGEPVLLETHTSGGRGDGPFYGSEEIQAAMRSAMAKLAAEFGGEAYALETVRP